MVTLAHTKPYTISIVMLKLFYGPFLRFHVRGTNSFLFSFSRVLIYSHLQ